MTDRVDFNSVKISVRGLDAWYGPVQVLFNVSVDFPRGRTTALMGASGGGKTTLLRCLNQIIQSTSKGRFEGRIIIDGEDVAAKQKGIHKLRRRFGVLAQKPNPFPRSVYDNVAYGPRLHGLAKTRQQLDATVRNHLQRVGLWEEVRESLDDRATNLSVGQQQRLCIARALAYEPEVLLLDEPCAALDPVNAANVEALIRSLKDDYTIIMVSHHVELVGRVADFAVHVHEGRAIESGPVDAVLNAPRMQPTQEFVARSGSAP